MQQKVMIFEGQMNAHFWEECCLGAVENTVPTKVGRPDTSEAALNAEFGEALVKRHQQPGTSWFRRSRTYQF